MSDDIWKDPMVREVLKERPANDIMVMRCPRCGKLGYYNQGSHFSCTPCDLTFYVQSEGEPLIDGPVVHAEDAMLLADCLEDGDCP